MKKITFVLFLTLVLDILTKQIVIHTLVEQQSIVIIKNFFSLTFAKNTGIAFSLFEGKLIFIILMSLVVIFFIIQYLKDKKVSLLESVCYGVIIGGAIGNLLDRIVYGYVIDFFDFSFFGYHFPIFNVADICIVVGIFGLFILNFKEKDVKI